MSYLILWLSSLRWNSSRTVGFILSRSRQIMLCVGLCNFQFCDDCRVLFGPHLKHRDILGFNDYGDLTCQDLLATFYHWYCFCILEPASSTEPSMDRSYGTSILPQHAQGWICFHQIFCLVSIFLTESCFVSSVALWEPGGVAQRAVLGTHKHTHTRTALPPVSASGPLYKDGWQRFHGSRWKLGFDWGVGGFGSSWHVLTKVAFLWLWDSLSAAALCGVTPVRLWNWHWGRQIPVGIFFFSREHLKTPSSTSSLLSF